MDIKKRQMSESFMIGSILAMVGGYLDAYTYIARGKVFANAQTGNIVLMGLNLAKGNFHSAILYFFPIIAFVCGILVAEFVRHKCIDKKSVHWRQIIVVMEIVVICVVGILPEGSLNMLANILVSFICAMQVETFRKLHGSPYATTMCTGNLRSATEKLFLFGLNRNDDDGKKSKEYYLIIAFFIIGVMGGGVLTPILLQKAVLITAAMLIVVFFMMFKEEEM